ANNARALVVSVDYGLAPEHVFPEPVQESLSAVEWIRRQANDWGGQSSRDIGAGSTAGGNLATAVALESHLRGESSLIGVMLFYPAVDGTHSLESHRVNGTGYLLSGTEMSFYWQAY